MPPLNERSKAIYQPWNQEGFNADLRVRKMSSIQRWMYKTLLQEAFVCSTRPRLPADDDELWIMADCENLEQWLANKDPILKMFTEVPYGDRILLEHKRLEEDWERLLEKRDIQSDKSRKGGLARQKALRGEQDSATGKPQAAVSKPQESLTQPSKEVSKQVSEEREEKEVLEDKTMRARNGVTLASRKILGVRAEIWESTWSEIKELEQIYGGTEVCNAFEEWAKTKVGEIRDKPVTEFLKVADGLLMGTLKLHADPALTALLDDLVYAGGGGTTFTESQQFALGQLLTEYTAAEIKTAFRDFLSAAEEDAYRLKNAARLFPAEAAQLIKFNRRKAQEKAQETAAVAEQAERMQREAEELRIARRASQTQEQDAVEDVLGG